MKYYSFGELDFIEQAWVAAYVKNVTRMVEERGGRYLARTAKIEQLEGEGKPPQLVVLIEWPSKEVAQEFYESAEYRPYRDSRYAGAKNRFHLIAGEDVTKSARLSESAVPRDAPG